MFKAEHFDPQAWAKLFKESGAQYVVPVFEHHDGFPMYDTGLSDWTAVKMGPQRDTWWRLGEGGSRRGPAFRASSHRVEHNFFLGVGRSHPLRRERSEVRVSLRSGAPVARSTTRRRRIWQRLDLRQPRPGRTTGWHATRRSWRSTSRTSSTSTGGSGSPSVRADLAEFAAFYYNTRCKTEANRRHQLQGLRHTGSPAYSTSSAASSTDISPRIGRPTPRSATNPGDTSSTTPSRPPSSSSIN